VARDIHERDEKCVQNLIVKLERKRPHGKTRHTGKGRDLKLRYLEEMCPIQWLRVGSSGEVL
jgi:hypothetical protein